MKRERPGPGLGPGDENVCTVHSLLVVRILCLSNLPTTTTKTYMCPQPIYNKKNDNGIC